MCGFLKIKAFHILRSTVHCNASEIRLHVQEAGLILVM